MMKNKNAQNNHLKPTEEEIHSTVYTTVVSLDGNEDWSVARGKDGSLTVTDLQTCE